jgi:hypothetical protein
MNQPVSKRLSPSQYNHAVKIVPCPSCGAQSFTDCTTLVEGRKTVVHSSRQVAYAISIAPTGDPPTPSQYPVLALPMRAVPDWMAVADTVERCGAMRLSMEVTRQMARSAHVALHRRGVGIYMLRDGACDQLGWIVQPLKGRS